ncbi:MAG: response regulator [Firmicutes bacterium]|nr:response regulator [Bacillota bacterium]
MGRKILAIDDDQDFVTMMELTLKAFDFDPVIAIEGSEGLKKFEAEKPDLVLLDIMMPGIDGFKILEQIKSNPSRHKHTPIIMLTAKADSADRDKALSLGADDYVTKPFEPMTLKRKIEFLLSKTNCGSRQ